jgi:RluA family pseudouridine synthase
MTFAQARETTLTSVVGKDYDGRSLLEYLCERFRYRDRKGWQTELALGRLMLNGKAARGQERVRAKDRVSYTAPRREPEVARDIPVLWEDEALLVVAKPAPLPVHSDGVFITNTLINILRERTRNPALSLGHRLDRETSGVLVLAKKRLLVTKLMAAFDSHDVEKRYLAVVRGEAPFQETLLRGWLVRAEASQVALRQRLLTVPAAGAKDSATRFILKERLRGYSLLECRPLTGRTNQIRVHLEHLGLPLVGDKLYGRDDRFYLDFIRHVKAGGGQDFGGRLEHPRHLLHAWRLSLRHPLSGERMTWEAPIPTDMEAFIRNYR